MSKGARLTSQLRESKPKQALTSRRLELNKVTRQTLSFTFQSPQAIRDALRAFHAAVVIATHLRASLVDAADIVSLAARSLDLLERVATFRNSEVVLGAALLLHVIDLQPVELHTINLVARFVINFATGEGHRHAALAADQTQLRLSLGGQSLFHSVYLFDGAIETGEYN
jgi:hypothetical protein